jgi:heat-inducible transcriptional repressor
MTGLTLEQVRARLVEEVKSDRATHDEAGQPRAEARQRRCSRHAVAGSAGRRAVQPARRQGRISNAPKLLLRTLEEKDLVVRLLGADAERARHLRVHRRRGEPGRSDRRLGRWPRPTGRRAGRSGTIGVIGPARMNYSRVIPLVDFTAETIGEAIGKT